VTSRRDLWGGGAPCILQFFVVLSCRVEAALQVRPLARIVRSPCNVQDQRSEYVPRDSEGDKETPESMAEIHNGHRPSDRVNLSRLAAGDPPSGLAH
jgi:hypothetical protein